MTSLLSCAQFYLPQTGTLIAMLSRPLWSCRFLLALMVLTGSLSGKPASAGDASLRQWPAGTPAPALKLNDLDGKPWDIRELRGKVVVLNFWASWCPPCVDELPFLNALAGNDAAKENLVVLGINFKGSAPAIQRFLNEHSFRYPILVDKTGEHFKRWTTGVMPTTILIDRNGRPRWRIVGELNPADVGFRQALEKMLQEPQQDTTRRPRIAATRPSFEPYYVNTEQ